MPASGKGFSFLSVVDLQLTTDKVAAVGHATECSTPSTSGRPTPMSASICELLLSESDYSIHELPTESEDCSTNETSHNDSSFCNEQQSEIDSGVQVTVNAALLYRVEALEGENQALKNS